MEGQAPNPFRKAQPENPFRKGRENRAPLQIASKDPSSPQPGPSKTMQPLQSLPAGGVDHHTMDPQLKDDAVAQSWTVSPRKRKTRVHGAFVDLSSEDDMLLDEEFDTGTASTSVSPLRGKSPWEEASAQTEIFITRSQSPEQDITLRKVKKPKFSKTDGPRSQDYNAEAAARARTIPTDMMRRFVSQDETAHETQEVENSLAAAPRRHFNTKDRDQDPVQVQGVQRTPSGTRLFPKDNNELYDQLAGRALAVYDNDDSIEHAQATLWSTSQDVRAIMTESAIEYLKKNGGVSRQNLAQKIAQAQARRVKPEDSGRIKQMIEEAERNLAQPFLAKSAMAQKSKRGGATLQKNPDAKKRVSFVDPTPERQWKLIRDDCGSKDARLYQLFDTNLLSYHLDKLDQHDRRRASAADIQAEMAQQKSTALAEPMKAAVFVWRRVDEVAFKKVCTGATKNNQLLVTSDPPLADLAKQRAALISAAMAGKTEADGEIIKLPTLSASSRCRASKGHKMVDVHRMDDQEMDDIPQSGGASEEPPGKLPLNIQMLIASEQEPLPLLVTLGANMGQPFRPVGRFAPQVVTSGERNPVSWPLLPLADSNNIVRLESISGQDAMDLDDCSVSEGDLVAKYEQDKSGNGTLSLHLTAETQALIDVTKDDVKVQEDKVEEDKAGTNDIDLVTEEAEEEEAVRLQLQKLIDKYGEQPDARTPKDLSTQAFQKAAAEDKECKRLVKLEKKRQETVNGLTKSVLKGDWHDLKQISLLQKNVVAAFPLPSKPRPSMRKQKPGCGKCGRNHTTKSCKPEWWMKPMPGFARVHSAHKSGGPVNAEKQTVPIMSDELKMKMREANIRQKEMNARARFGFGFDGMDESSMEREDEQMKDLGGKESGTHDMEEESDTRPEQLFKTAALPPVQSFRALSQPYGLPSSDADLSLRGEETFQLIQSRQKKTKRTADSSLVANQIIALGEEGCEASNKPRRLTRQSMGASRSQSGRPRASESTDMATSTQSRRTTAARSTSRPEQDEAEVSEQERSPSENKKHSERSENIASEDEDVMESVEGSGRNSKVKENTGRVGRSRTTTPRAKSATTESPEKTANILYYYNSKVWLLPVQVGDVVVRRLTEKDREYYGKADQYDEFEGPWEVVEIKARRKHKAMLEMLDMEDVPEHEKRKAFKETLTVEIKLNVPERSLKDGTKAWRPLSMLLPVLDSEGIKYGAVYPANLSIQQTDSYKKLVARLADPGDLSVESNRYHKRLASGQDAGDSLGLVNLRKNLFVAVSDIGPNCTANEEYEVEKIRKKRVKLVWRPSADAEILAQEDTDKWQEILKHKTGDALKHYVIVVQWWIQWAGWPIESSTWESRASFGDDTAVVDHYNQHLDVFRATPVDANYYLDHLFDHEREEMEKCRKAVAQAQAVKKQILRKSKPRRRKVDDSDSDPEVKARKAAEKQRLADLLFGDDNDEAASKTQKTKRRPQVHAERNDASTASRRQMALDEAAAKETEDRDWVEDLFGEDIPSPVASQQLESTADMMQPFATQDNSTSSKATSDLAQRDARSMSYSVPPMTDEHVAGRNEGFRTYDTPQKTKPTDFNPLYDVSPEERKTIQQQPEDTAATNGQQSTREQTSSSLKNGDGDVAMMNAAQTESAQEVVAADIPEKEATTTQVMDTGEVVEQLAEERLFVLQDPIEPRRTIAQHTEIDAELSVGPNGEVKLENATEMSVTVEKVVKEKSPKSRY